MSCHPWGFLPVGFIRPDALIVQPDGIAVPAQAAPSMKAQLAVFGTQPAPVQNAPRVSSERLAF
ncbi:hypothetical protein [Pseudomonas donghuensis]|uniref:hypothetical protein n=1 Tax=Pseudomonas donghuensis TaxID=1163398 RepID=UPI002E0D56E5|nr:hypothetical protein VP780_08025 [Pseudomonas donghuensis]